MLSNKVPEETSVPSAGWYRWGICALLFFATSLNYIDRQIIGILKPELANRFGWGDIDYSNIVTAFQIAYALGYAGAGRLIDRMGVRLGYALAVLFWSLAAMAHALNWFIPPEVKLGDWLSSASHTTQSWLFVIPVTVLGFSAARFALGLAEGGNFPAAIKAVGEWFPKKERALSTGIFNAGSNVGAIAAPLMVPWLTVKFGWPMAFLVTGVLGFAWLVAWQLFYQSPEKHPRLSSAELAYIRSDPPDPVVKIPWLTLLRYRQTWAFVVGTFLSAPIWWFYLYWIPDFLNKRHGLDLLHLGPPLVAIYLIADVGSVCGGWLSSWLIKRGWTVNAARKTAMLACAICVVPVFAASSVSNLWTATLLIGLAASAHQGFSANLFTLVSDTAPRQVVSSIVGIGGMAGAIGGMFIAKLAGYVLQWTGDYRLLFAIASCAYLVNLLVIHLLNPRLKPMEFITPQAART
ncbi:MAG: MFS transporter [Sedimentisphaerales bacterium]|jgi:ACS family hexuronate transporter-like MFS transporter